MAPIWLTMLCALAFVAVAVPAFAAVLVVGSILHRVGTIADEWVLRGSGG